jgi:hypothetical protein
VCWLVPLQVAVAVTVIGCVLIEGLIPRTVAVPTTVAVSVSVLLLIVAC